MVNTAQQHSIVIDLDNTIVDTAIRKQKILKDKFDINLSLDEIREDFYLLKCFGNKNSETYKKFIELLDSPMGIQDYRADVFPNSITIINKFSKSQIVVIYV